MSKNSVIKRFLGICVVLTALVLGSSGTSRFLVDEEQPVRREEPRNEEKKPVASKSKHPPHIAYNLRAQKITDVKGAVRVTWKSDPAATGDFIVGRSSKIPNTREKALSASSIKIVPAASVNSVIDSDLAPGQYYYIVLSKDSVLKRTVEIYPDVNYTTVPVVIEQEIKYKRTRVYPDQVTLIHAQITNRTHVMLTWKSPDTSGIVYTIYRDTEPLTGPDSLKKAEKIAEVTGDRESYLDRTIKSTGTYYYAVTTRDIIGNEDQRLVPDQSYLTTGIYVSFKMQIAVSGVSARPKNRKSVVLKWKSTDTGITGYLIYRYSKPINNNERLALAKLVASLRPGRSSYTDVSPGSGMHYYAVLAKLEDETVDKTLRQGENFTVNAVTIGGKPESATSKGKPEVVYKTDSVDRVLRESFFKGQYKSAIKRLYNIIGQSDNEVEIAKAKLFIGRSLIELKMYSKALPYFVMPEVTRYFPEEARFWTEFSASRVR